MSEKDFVIAWLLATRAGSGGAFETAYNAIEKEYSNETNS
jgi:hypothetical protein